MIDGRTRTAESGPRSGCINEHWPSRDLACYEVDHERGKRRDDGQEPQPQREEGPTLGGFHVPGTPIAEDLVDRKFLRARPNELWLTDITEHPTREGKVYCAVVLDAFSRRVVGWSISHNPTATLTCNALGMAIEQRDAIRGTVIHSDHGTQFTAWTSSEQARKSGLLPSMGSVGDCYDNAMMEALWSRMQVELLDSRRWKTRVELANAIFEYIEVFHNRRRRHSALGMRTPIEFELINNTITPVAA